MNERHERVTALIHEIAANFIRHEANTNPMITVTRVDTSPDYKNATIFFTTIPEGREEDAQVFLKRFGGELRHTLKKKTDLKTIPFLSFAVDHGERHRQHIDEVTRQIEREKHE